MRSLTLSLYFLLLLCSLQAQTGQISGILGNRPFMDLFRRLNMDNSRSLRGSPFWHPNWEKGIFVFNDKTLVKDVPVKILFFEEPSVIAKRPEGDSIIINMEKIKEVRIFDSATKDTARFQRIVHSEKVSGEIMQVLYEGQISLLLKHSITFVPAEPTRAMGTGRTYDEFVEKIEYFVVKKGYPVLKKLKVNKKGILEALSGQDKALTDYIQTQKLDLDKNGDLAKLVAYYDKIQGK
jgi:hypothetical protein